MRWCPVAIPCTLLGALCPEQPAAAATVTGQVRKKERPREGNEEVGEEREPPCTSTSSSTLNSPPVICLRHTKILLPIWQRITLQTQTQIARQAVSELLLLLLPWQRKKTQTHWLCWYCTASKVAAVVSVCMCLIGWCHASVSEPASQPNNRAAQAC